MAPQAVSKLWQRVFLIILFNNNNILKYLILATLQKVCRQIYLLNSLYLGNVLFVVAH